MLLAGSFSEYPLSLLLEILLHRRETGLLEVSSPKQSGFFYIKNGEIRDGEVGKLRGAAAVELAGSFVDASFQFKPLEPTDYARVVWEKSFGGNPAAGDTPDIRVQAFRTMLEQFLSYTEAAFGILERAVVSLAQRALRQLLFYVPTTYRNLEKAGVFIARRTLAYATAAFEFSKRAQARKKLLPALPLNRKRAAMLPSLQQVAESNISFGVIIIALLAGTAVTISQILRSNQVHVGTLATADENAGTQAQPIPVSTERAKRKPRNGSQAHPEKKRDASLAQKPNVLPQVTDVQAPRNAASDSDGSTRQAATTLGAQTITVVLQIENGRVSQASLLKHRTGLEGYEAAALQIARQRRYSPAGKHTETVVVKVNQPNPN
jgi:hypothetical protein